MTEIVDLAEHRRRTVGDRWRRELARLGVTVPPRAADPEVDRERRRIGGRQCRHELSGASGKVGKVMRDQDGVIMAELWWCSTHFVLKRAANLVPDNPSGGRPAA